MNDSSQIDKTINHLFRQESGRMVSVLLKIFGSNNLELAEDVVQDALISALETWKIKGVPDNPKAWLYRAAKNKAIDMLRKEKFSESIDFEDPERQLLKSEYTLANTMEQLWDDDSIKDDFLAMMFACCHPEISEENQITFILKSLCGFSTKEVASSFLTSEDTISKRLYRTKEFFRKSGTRPKIPSSNEIVPRTKAVLNSIYLMFNEGYNSTHADELVREDLITQALLLCRSLTEHEKTNLPEVYALMALMCFHASRSKSRVSEEGEMVLLADQNRNLWNQELITLGNQYLNQSAFGKSMSMFHLEAAIASAHCAAQKFEDTDWKLILNCYDQMLAVSEDPVVRINRSIAVAEISGAKTALESLKQLEKDSRIQKYYMYHSVVGEFNERLNQHQLARNHYELAKRLTQSEREKSFLDGKLKKLSHLTN